MDPQTGQSVPDEDLPDQPAEANRSPASSQPESASGQEVPGEDLPQTSGMEVPDEDVPQGLESNYEEPDQQLKTVAEGAARGLLGPVAPWAETHILGVNPENITAREEANPILSKGSEAATFAGSMMLGTGEAAVFSKIGEAAANAANAGKLGSTLIKGGIEAGMFQGGDEISKAILGQGDPNDPVSSALLHTGAATLLGSGISGTIEGVGAPLLAKIGESKMGTRFSQFLSDMGSRLKFNQEYPNMVDALGSQMEDLHSAMGAVRPEVYGPSGIKAQNINLLTQDVTKDQTAQHIGDVSQMLLDAPDEIQSDPLFKRSVTNWKNQVNGQIDPITLQPTGAQPSPADVFQATDQLKREVQGLAKFGYTGSAASVVADQVSPLSGKLADTLENTSTWNKAGDFQKELNAAVSDFIPKNKNFLSQFTAKDATDPNRIISPGKINTYLNQLGKPNAEIKQQFLKDWVDSSETLQQRINGIHQSLGLQTPLSTPPTDIIRSTLGESSAGSKAADALYHLGIPKLAQSLGGTAVGGEVGYREGGVKGAVIGGMTGALAGAIAPHLQEAALIKLRQYAVPGLIRALSSGAPETAGSVLNYASSAAKGASKLSSGISALFKAGGTQAIDSYASDSDKEKIHKFVESGEMNRQVRAQAHQPAPAPSPVQYFAEGGEVKSPMTQPVPTTPAQPVLKSIGGIERAMPEHATLISAAKSRVNNYLNSVRPIQGAPKLPFDDEPKNSEKDRSYQKALDLAANPLGILNHMKAGTLTPETLKHFTSLWPEIHGHISKKLTEKITESQMKGEKPSYRVRQSMSLFLGAPLDSTLTPQAIQSIQSIYAAKASSPTPGVPPKKQSKNTSKLGEIPKDHYTQDQASAQRATAWD